VGLNTLQVQTVNLQNVALHQGVTLLQNVALQDVPLFLVVQNKHYKH
jgi:hypothetical protein